MYLPTDHPSYSLPMEVLCTLPLSPIAVPVSDLILDFETSMEAMIALLRGLKYAGEPVLLLNTGSKSPYPPEVALARHFRSYNAEIYWRKVHNNGEP